MPSPELDAAQPQLNATQSRRRLLAGAAGGAAALVVALTRPARLRAAIGDPLLAGSTVGAAGATTGVTNNSDTNATLLVTQNGKGTAVRGQAAKGTGGRFTTGSRNKFGLVASNSATTLGEGGAIQANGGVNHAIVATIDTTSGIAILATNASQAQSSSAGSGIRGLTFGHTVDDLHPAGQHYQAAGEFAGPIGVIGASNQGGGFGVLGLSPGNMGVRGVSGTGFGVVGSSTSGFGVYGSSTGNYAGYFEGEVFMNDFLALGETGVPTTPANTEARLFVRDSSGKTELCVLFNDGVVQVLAAQP